MFTPGPWIAEPQVGADNWDLTVNDDMLGRIWLGSIHGDHHTPGQRPQSGFPGNVEAKGNAHLIMAAPDLYAALVALTTDAPWQNAPHDLLTEARAVLAKAEGRI